MPFETRTGCLLLRFELKNEALVRFISKQCDRVVNDAYFLCIR